MFCRKYSLTGSHAGFIISMTDATQDQEDMNNIREAIKVLRAEQFKQSFYIFTEWEEELNSEHLAVR